ncbi:hypothetical protein L249_2660 [Ophiocordyceps polyrhachis-furcata BCC 54312]|uniref:assimilatory sulfite reductase (NADPH) n=1 Tax=Ophiocordyceps polyrhachis-furcata BCC 54312 TaxID=1330021 RepID=A0A367LQ16_9HYPO|nr:hypothetical protein L249_2660 [Ophiocordyceps polyrhachis-furcata BCC 54312]
MSSSDPASRRRIAANDDYEDDDDDNPLFFSSSLPFGRLPASLASVSCGPAYVTAQLLVQQVAYRLSDNIYSYSPETFDLDLAVRRWSLDAEPNIHGRLPAVLPLQTRTGAGALALGYVFSPDFPVGRRHVPQTLLAPSGSLQHLRSTLDQLSLLYGLSSPFVAHVAAADYVSGGRLVSDYDTVLRLAEDLGLGLVATSSAYEAQHMSLFSTLLATLIPTVHVYDGIRVARETLRVVDALNESGLADLYGPLATQAQKLNPRLDTAGKVLELLRLFNDQLGTVYAPFEYHGHETPDVVVVAFGSVETQVAKQTLSRLAADGTKVGVVNVRLYRPFIDEAFLDAVPSSTRTLAVLGQVCDEAAVNDGAVRSALHADVLTAVTLSMAFEREPHVVDVKYAPAQAVTPRWLVETLRDVSGGESLLPTNKLSSLVAARQYIFWDVDDSATTHAPDTIGKILSRESTTNVYAHKAYDNLIQGGVVRTDLRASRIALEAPYEVDEADVAVVGDERLLKEVDVLESVAQGGKLLLRLPGFRPDDVEKRLPAGFRRSAHAKGVDLFVVDTSHSPALDKEPLAAKLLLELSFLKTALPSLSAVDVGQRLGDDGHHDLTFLPECVDAVEKCLSKLEVPEAWADCAVAVDGGSQQPALRTCIETNSFVPFQKLEIEPEPALDSWRAAARGLIFKEAYQTQTSLRPDLSVKTATIHVKENRRLTPVEYDRNIFHLEFDLGDSGLTYDIGEALGIHADNDEELVDDFIRSYGVDADALVQVPSREDPAVVEVRTARQALVRSVDILGKPPKRFYEALSEHATDEAERRKLAALGGSEGAAEFKRRSEEDTLTYVDVLDEFRSARPALGSLMRMVGPLKRREYSIASAQAVTPNSVALMIVVVSWVDSKGRTRHGQATRYLSRLQPGAAVTVSVKASVMKLPAADTSPLIMAGLGTGLAPFRAFVQYRAMQKAQGKEIGAILLYLGSRHQREEYLYGEEWEAYLAAGVVTLLGSAFSRDQPHKIYIQDRMRQTLDDIVQAYVRDQGSFYLCGPTWPVPDVTEVLQEAIAAEATAGGRRLDPKKEIEKLKEEGRYVLEVY